MTSADARPEPEAPLAALDGFRVARGNATPEEEAAALAVLAHALQEAAERPAGVPQGQDAWTRSRRPLRTPLRPGYGAWRGFSG